MTLKRTEFKRKAPIRSSRPTGILAQASFAKVRKPMKLSRPKMTPIRASARGEDCTLQIPGVCNRNPETVVWAHSNNYVDGKGAGKKARDEEGCYSCFACHAFYDGGYANAGWDRLAVDSLFNRARALSREILRQKGLL
jgi:hypothetical protein